MREITVAIDGPAGSGKSTIAKILAKKYNMTYLDTGAMYRMVSFFLLEKGVDLDNNAEIVKKLNEIHLDIQGDNFFINGVDVSKEIRTPEVTAIVSKVSAVKEVRVKLVDLQREIAKGKRAILDGRDIGTVVFPKAHIKIFLVASPEERAKRRVKDYSDKGIVEEQYEDVLAAIKERDFLDSTRAESPLKKAEDAVEIDSSFMNIEEVCNKISQHIETIEGRK
ncbi:MAG: (d)CMP kinase [Fusobacteriaceae bacterium]|nr:(d)CMP kinase [Fusobacteriaceae bacterium]MBP6322460.1 (d)CMP kinase [Fusobacteriaceae bacterium]MBP9509788.1 (d)CMP kinase [Fusobacteriaceae bacterium]